MTSIPLPTEKTTSVGVEDNQWEIAKKMTLHGQNTAKEQNHKVNQNAGSSPITGPSNHRQWDVNEAFKRAKKLIMRGVLRPSQYALQNWVKEEYSIIPNRNDIATWQVQLEKEGIIEPVVTGNGKQSFKLKLVYKDTRFSQAIESQKRTGCLP